MTDEKHSGFETITVPLSAYHLECLGYLMTKHGISRTEAVALAIEAAVEGKIQREREGG